MINDRLTSAEKCQVLGHGSAFGINLMHFAEPEAGGGRMQIGSGFRGMRS